MTDGVGGELQPVADHQDVGRLQPTLHQVFAVKETQSIEEGRQHFTHFVQSQ
jgi:hypothetical protein